MEETLNRRRFLSGAASLSLAAFLPRQTEKSRKTRLILLGTGGGPRPRKQSSGSSQVVVANGVPYVIDCGDGVARQLVFADVPLSTLQAPVEDAARVAQEAGVRTLVLSHLIPGDDPEVTEAMWLEAARAHFRGPVIVGKDLMEI